VYTTIIFVTKFTHLSMPFCVELRFRTASSFLRQSTKVREIIGLRAGGRASFPHAAPPREPSPPSGPSRSCRFSHPGGQIPARLEIPPKDISPLPGAHKLGCVQPRWFGLEGNTADLGGL